MKKFSLYCPGKARTLLGMENERPYKDFDLPTKHLGTDGHFIPPKARDEEEIARRRALAPGTLMAEFQERGLSVAATILKIIERSDDVAFATKILAAGGLNSAWYTFARGAENEVMRRRLKLPYLAQYRPNLQQSSSDILYDAAHMFGAAALPAREAVSALQYNPRKYEQCRRKVGRITGKAALTLACVPLGDQIPHHPEGLTSFDIQLLVRQRCLKALQDSRALTSVVGVAPSIAQLADPDSHLSVFWRRESPNGALQAYETAVEIYGNAA